MKRTGRLAALGVAGLVVAAAAAAQQARVEWPQWRGPNRDAISKDTGLLKEWRAGGPPLAWQASGLGAGFSSVSLANGRLYTMGDLDGEQHVLALDPSNGRMLRKTKVGLIWDGLAVLGGLTHEAFIAGRTGPA